MDYWPGRAQLQPGFFLFYIEYWGEYRRGVGCSRVSAPKNGSNG
jgi:hypothetical protein